MFEYLKGLFYNHPIIVILTMLSIIFVLALITRKIKSIDDQVK